MNSPVKRYKKGQCNLLKTCSLLLLLGLLIPTTYAQVKIGYDYDANGNRIRRTSVPVPDLTLTLAVNPSTTNGVTNLTATIRIFELKNVSTTGLITVKLVKDFKTTFSFNSATGQNSIWSFSGPSGGYYTLTTSTVLLGGSNTTITLTGVLDPQATSGQLTCNALVVGGGEVNTGNDNAASVIYYFP